jgi:hypothetical protein
VYTPATSGVNDAVMYFVTRPAAPAVVTTPLVTVEPAFTFGSTAKPVVAAVVIAKAPEVAGIEMIVPVTVAVSAEVAATPDQTIFAVAAVPEPTVAVEATVALPSVAFTSVSANMPAACDGTTESIPKPNEATATSAMRLKVVFVDICFLSISQDQEFPEIGFG